MQKEYIEKIFNTVLKKIGVEEDKEIIFETPKNPEHGDLSTNIAMQLAKTLRKAPKIIAGDILTNLEYDSKNIKSVEIAGAGFINIKFTDYFYTNALKELAEKKENLGRHDIGKGKKVNVEYVSVNPTGLLHLGHGRNAVIGDTIANLYHWLGYDVTREYYFNNAGNQMNILAKSIYARYRQKLGDPDYVFPEDGYHGDYINDIAEGVVDKYGESLKEETDKNITELRKIGEKWCFDKIRNTLSRINIKQDVFFNEDSLYHSGKIKKVIEDFKSLGLAYEKENALWLELTKLGLNDDRVIVKSTGEPTYRLPDIAYHREKFERGFEIIVDLFGSDHTATVPDVLAGVKALGYDSDKVKVLIHQFVTLTEDGEQVKMSKRTGKNYTLDDLLDEVGEDVVRFFLLMRGISTHLEFDLNLAREQSDKNPVFYLQYAHARICSIFDNAKEKGINIKEETDYGLLQHQSEIKLIKLLIKFPETTLICGEKSEPQILAEYMRELAGAFHVFYHDCRVIGVEENIMQARFKLAEVTRTAMKNGLTIFGVSAPERM